MRHYPALSVRWPKPPTDEDVDRLLATVDDNGPVAVESDGSDVCLYFDTADHRDEADHSVARDLPELIRERRLVADENWAERNQAGLEPVRVGRLVVAPPWAVSAVPNVPGTIRIVVQPSMGFGTGHHASTRLCLELLQQYVQLGHSVVDVGTGSGVLAIAAALLGATAVLAIDTDADALANAAENILLSGAAATTIREMDVVDLPAVCSKSADVLTANLTGALICRAAPDLIACLAPHGVLIVSGVQTEEREQVQGALEAHGATIEQVVDEDGWVGLAGRLRR